MLEILSTDGPSEFLVVSRSRWDMHQRRLNVPRRQSSSASSCERQWQEGLEERRAGWSSLERKVMEAVEGYLEKCATAEVDVEALERLMEPENEEVSPRYILKYSTRGGSHIFQLCDTAEKKDHFVTSRTRLLEGQGKNVAQAKKLAQ